MCLPTHVVIVIMNLGAMIGVVNGQAWDKATTQFLSLNRSYLILSFFMNVD
jgi:hypothetical protein